MVGVDAEIRNWIVQMLSCKDLTAIEYKVSCKSSNGVEIEEKVKLFDELFDALKGEQISRNAVIAKCSRIIKRTNGEEISEEKEIKSQGFVTELKEKIRISGRESIVEWAADWLTEGFKQELSPSPDLDDVTVATNQRSRQQQ